MKAAAIALALLTAACGSGGEDLPDFRIADPPAPPTGAAVRTLHFDRDGAMSGAKTPAEELEVATAVLSSERAAPAERVLRQAYALGIYRLFLAGRRSDDSVGCLPLWEDVDSARGLQRLGAAIIPSDTVGGLGWEGALTLRIERSGGGVRYRWGHLYYAPQRPEGSKPWDEGDATFPVTEVEAAGRGPLIPALAATFARREAARPGPATVVQLELAPETRVVDLLRAVECAAGRRNVAFECIRVRGDRDAVRLPVPAPGDTAFFPPRKSEDAFRGRIVVTIPAVRDGGNPKYQSRGKDARIGDIPFQVGFEYLGRVDEGIPWSFVEPLLERARQVEARVSFAFSYDAGQFREWSLDVLPPADGAEAVEVHLASAIAPPAPVEGKGVKLVIPEDATSGPVLRAALHLLRLGASGVTFASGT